MGGGGGINEVHKPGSQARVTSKGNKQVSQASVTSQSLKQGSQARVTSKGHKQKSQARGLLPPAASATHSTTAALQRPTSSSGPADQPEVAAPPQNTSTTHARIQGMAGQRAIRPRQVRAGVRGSWGLARLPPWLPAQTRQAETMRRRLGRRRGIPSARLDPPGAETVGAQPHPGPSPPRPPLGVPEDPPRRYCPPPGGGGCWRRGGRLPGKGGSCLAATPAAPPRAEGRSGVPATPKNRKRGGGAEKTGKPEGKGSRGSKYRDGGALWKSTGLAIHSLPARARAPASQPTPLSPLPLPTSRPSHPPRQGTTQACALSKTQACALPRVRGLCPAPLLPQPPPTPPQTRPAGGQCFIGYNSGLPARPPYPVPPSLKLPGRGLYLPPRPPPLDIYLRSACVPSTPPPLPLIFTCARTAEARASAADPSGPSHACVSKVSRHMAASPHRLDIAVTVTQPSTNRP